MKLETFKQVVLPLQEKLFFYARNMLTDSDDAHDAVQETFVRLWNARAKLATHPNIEGYAMLALKNICFDKIRARKHTVSLDEVQIGTGRENPATSTENSNQVAIIKTIIEQLPTLQQLIITLRDIEEYELAEIAQITGTSIDAVKTNLSRARKKVRAQFLQIEAMKLNKME